MAKRRTFGPSRWWWTHSDGVPVIHGSRRLSAFEITKPARATQTKAAGAGDGSATRDQVESAASAAIISAVSKSITNGSARASISGKSLGRTNRLLALVGETGSIREAAERMGMSYMRAWTLIKTMNACFKEPLVIAVRGGKKHGGTVLTESGRQALRLYQEMERACLEATAARWNELRSILRD
jgi:molybdate transport system regulatory protein